MTILMLLLILLVLFNLSRFLSVLLPSFLNQIVPHGIIQINPLSQVLFLTLTGFFDRRIEPPLRSNIKSLDTRLSLLIQLNLTFLAFTVHTPPSFPFRFLSIVS